MSDPRTVKIVTIDTVVTSRHRAVITADEIRTAFDLAPNAKICVDIPGGGDWSNTELCIDEIEGLVITWQTEVRT